MTASLLRKPFIERLRTDLQTIEQVAVREQAHGSRMISRRNERPEGQDIHCNCAPDHAEVVPLHSENLLSCSPQSAAQIEKASAQALARVLVAGGIPQKICQPISSKGTPAVDRQKGEQRSGLAHRYLDWVAGRIAYPEA